MAFSEQFQKRLENDHQAMEKAFSDLASIVGYSKEKSSPEEKKKAVQGAIEEILSSLGVKVPQVPEEIDDMNARLEYMLRPSGVMRRRVELTGKWWKNTAGPLLGSTKAEDVVAILPTFPSGYVFFDAELGKRVKVNRKTAPKLNSEAYCFYPALPAKKLNVLDLVRFFLHSVASSDFALVFGASLLVSLLGLFTPYMNKQIFDSVIPSGTKSDVLPVAALLAGAAVGSSLFGITRSLVLMRLRDKINLSVQSAAMARIFSLPAGFFKDFSAGELSSRAMSINQLCSLLSDTVLTTLLSALFSFVYIFQMVNYAPTLVRPGLLIIFAMLAVTILTAIFQQRLYDKQMKLSAKLNGLVFGLFSGVQKVKLAGAEKRAFAKWAADYKETARFTFSPPLFLKLKTAISGALTLGGTLLLYYVAGTTKIAPADYIAFSTAYGAVSGAIMSLAGIVLTIANIKPLLQMVKPIFEAIPEIDENKKSVTSLSGTMEVSNVSFRYSPDGPIILDNLSLKVKPGEYIGVVGQSGCGKSTLMRLLLGFEKPEEGAVYFDGYDLETLDVRSVRQCIGVALQNGKLFTENIFSNIIITAPWSTLDDAWKAARMAGLEDEIKAMPMGMHTLISEGSGGISGGQRQRILIARALVSNPKILFFDEATSALDNITQKHVADSLDQLGCTRIVIAHRLSTVKNCDRIIVMNKGKIAEEGSFEELMERKGLFYEFAQRQIS
ncbi:NHLM bacteriocin system ABC transporter, ATP-binding protein [Desulfosporosinus orientis DSM 765]|uniref:NHLM bacteriocin system ABC transporter, ATP-binding protein n=1 Tax=Desulfosporosinus orientis (strain ATCC 19365 / DSM 765 / NCIMB 8382 / VKM B-1628 / Singapore I) TaxID=768706 RepID=G7W6V7_DESOD|nr:NHLP bacteriocin export ABC transporter permease/ATPase subunit [Desulfosporosinus orientis]AET69239.1 NHLM bacteriocin system ABC transporter, ATP-binding protein [Desulfosporosinus orientis DSM 765]